MILIAYIFFRQKLSYRLVGEVILTFVTNGIEILGLKFMSHLNMCTCHILIGWNMIWYRKWGHRISILPIDNSLIMKTSLLLLMRPYHPYFFLIFFIFFNFITSSLSSIWTWYMAKKGVASYLCSCMYQVRMLVMVVNLVWPISPHSCSCGFIAVTNISRYERERVHTSASIPSY